MKLNKIIFIISLFALSFSSIATAHPGRTDSSGGHTCRTNCEKWGLQYGEYHYHNGGRSTSSSSSSSPKTNAASSSPSIPPKEVIPAGHVKVNIPSYKVYVNNQQVFSNSSKYPVIEYKDITYFPMTFSYTQAFGLDTSWDNEVGFSVRKTDNKAGKLNMDSGTPANKLYAKQPDFSIFVNDSWVDNNNEEYPLLVLNDITYFPMTWKYAVEELGLTIKSESNAFYISK
jgi:hypothetical protein